MAHQLSDRKQEDNLEMANNYLINDRFDYRENIIGSPIQKMGRLMKMQGVLDGQIKDKEHRYDSKSIFFRKQNADTKEKSKDLVVDESGENTEEIQTNMSKSNKYITVNYASQQNLKLPFEKIRPNILSLQRVQNDQIDLESPDFKRKMMKKSSRLDLRKQKIHQKESKPIQKYEGNTSLENILSEPHSTSPSHVSKSEIGWEVYDKYYLPGQGEQHEKEYPMKKEFAKQSPQLNIEQESQTTPQMNVIKVSVKCPESPPPAREERRHNLKIRTSKRKQSHPQHDINRGQDDHQKDYLNIPQASKNMLKNQSNITSDQENMTTQRSRNKTGCGIYGPQQVIHSNIEQEIHMLTQNSDWNALQGKISPSNIILNSFMMSGDDQINKQNNSSIQSLSHQRIETLEQGVKKCRSHFDKEKDRQSMISSDSNDSSDSSSQNSNISIDTEGNRTFVLPFDISLRNQFFQKQTRAHFSNEEITRDYKQFKKIMTKNSPNIKSKFDSQSQNNNSNSKFQNNKLNEAESNLQFRYSVIKNSIPEYQKKNRSSDINSITPFHQQNSFNYPIQASQDVKNGRQFVEQQNLRGNAFRFSLNPIPVKMQSKDSFEEQNLKYNQSLVNPTSYNNECIGIRAKPDIYQRGSFAQPRYSNVSEDRQSKMSQGNNRIFLNGKSDSNQSENTPSASPVVLTNTGACMGSQLNQMNPNIQQYQQDQLFSQVNLGFIRESVEDFDKLKIFKRYFVHNNADVVINQLNRRRKNKAIVQKIRQRHLRRKKTLIAASQYNIRQQNLIFSGISNTERKKTTLIPKIQHNGSFFLSPIPHSDNILNPLEFPLIHLDDQKEHLVTLDQQNPNDQNENNKPISSQPLIIKSTQTNLLQPANTPFFDNNFMVDDQILHESNLLISPTNQIILNHSNKENLINSIQTNRIIIHSADSK